MRVHKRPVSLICLILLLSLFIQSNLGATSNNATELRVSLPDGQIPLAHSFNSLSLEEVANTAYLPIIKIERTAPQVQTEIDEYLFTAYQNVLSELRRFSPGLAKPWIINRIEHKDNWSYARVHALSQEMRGSPADFIILGHRDSKGWVFVPPLTNQANEFNDLLATIPSELISDQTKEYLFIPTSDTSLQGTAISGYKFPWFGKATIQCVGTSCAGNITYLGHETQLDAYLFDEEDEAGSGYIAAAKAGRVVYAKDVSDVECSSDGCYRGTERVGTCTGEACWPYANMVILEHQVPNGFEYSWYVHLAFGSIPIYLKQFDNQKGETGPFVPAGTILGREGATGIAYPRGNAHLHFMVASTLAKANFRERPQNDVEQAYWFTTIRGTLHDVNFDARPWSSLIPGETIVNPDSLEGNDVVSLITAINAANSNPDNTTLILPSHSIFVLNSSDNTTYGPTGLPVITSPITIIGNGATIQRDSSAPPFRLLAVAAGGELNLYNITLQGGYAPFTTSIDRVSRQGGGIYNLGKLHLNNVKIRENTTGEYGYGGGVYAEGVITISYSNFTDNSSPMGGAIYSVASVTINGGEFKKNIQGGAIYLCTSNDAVLSVVGATFEENNTVNSGAAINSCVPTTISGESRFIGNVSNDGGAIYGGSRGSLDIYNSYFQANQGTAGGAIRWTGHLYIQDSQFYDNIAVLGYLDAFGQGGAIYHFQNNLDGKLAIKNSVFRNNRAARYGGGIYEDGGDTAFEGAHITNSTFANNIAEGVSNPHGGNIYSQSYSLFSISGSCVVGTSSEGVFMSPTANHPQLDARNNWWGASNGPSGGMVNSNVGFVPFLTSPNRGCPGNDSLVDAQPITSTSPLNASSSLASKANDEPTPSCGTNVNRTLWYSFTASSAGTLRLETNSGVFNPILSAWVGMLDNLTELGCNGGSTGLAPMAATVNSVQRIRLEVEPGMKYYIMVGGNNASGGDFTLTTSFILPPPLNAAPSRNYYTISTPTLTWSGLTWAFNYEIQIANNISFSNAMAYPAGNSIEFTLPSPLANGTYYWRVRACSPATKCGGWSAADSFTIDVP